MTSTAKQIPYFRISPTKLYLLTFFTYGFFDVYWFYQNWTAVRDSKELRIMPTLRSIFSVLFVASLFGHIKESIAESRKNIRYSRGSLATLYIISNVTASIVSNGVSFSDLGYATQIGLNIALIMLLAIAIVPLYITQKAINDLPARGRNAKMSHIGPGGIIIIVLGFLIFAVNMYYSFVPAA